MSRLLVLMRHAEAADFAPGRHDRDRPLTERGHAQARAVGGHLRGAGVRVDHALVSSARRTRETADDLALDCPVDHLAALYNADPQTILESVAAAPDEAATVLVVAHNPGVHAAVLELADPRATTGRLAHSFPTATAVGLVVEGDWADLGRGLAVAFARVGG